MGRGSRGIEEIGPGEIKAAAEKVRLDTVYLLQGGERTVPHGH